MARRKSGRTTGKAATAPSNKGRSPKGGQAIWLWGGHAVLAALANPKRRCERLVITHDQKATWHGDVQPIVAKRSDLGQGIDVMGRPDLERLIGRAAVHQGIALLATPAPQPALADLLAGLDRDGPACVMLLDQVSDPQNVGAILRSCAAFGACAVVTTARNAPHETGALAKAASGGLESVPFIHVTNLARSMDALIDAGFRCLGLSGAGETLLPVAADSARTALVLGAEGAGLRRLTAERCDRLVSLPTVNALTDLNVANAAAVALYEVAGRPRAVSA
jgi:23S rRNA (guanosine2251-2'-O)-methyltransferase